MKVRWLLAAPVILTFFANLMACSPSEKYSYSLSSGLNSTFSEPTPVPRPIPNPNPAPDQQTKMLPLAWESKVKEAPLWSNYIYAVISLEEPQMLATNVATDVEFFCPRYKSLSTTERLNFWGQLFVGMAKYESNWKPTSRYIEATMGNDDITGLPTASEGLLQLSYQDVPNYNYVCEFDWNADKHLATTDPLRTILDPYKNLRCGIKIMARLLDRKKMISIDKGAYWSVLRPAKKVNEIAAITKSLKFCTTAN